MQNILENYFLIRHGHDNLPICAHTLPEQDGGRRQLARMMKELGLCSGIEVGTQYRKSAVM